MMFNDHTQQAGRVFGLDLMRTVAILLVVFWHSFQLMADHWSDDLLLWAIDGVDLFFVLSGFLIGGILLRMSEADEFPWWRRLLDFWQRRWLRTLPNYFLFLLVNIALVYYGLAPGILNVNTLAFFVFLQNFMIPVDLFFWESWSLAVEEWFYLLFPILLFFLVGRVRRAAPIRVLFATMIMILVPTILRFSAIDTIGTPFMLDVWMRKIVLYRLDTIGFGVLMACAAHYLPAVWQRRAPELFVLGTLGLVTAALLRGPNALVYMGTWFFTLSGASIALMLPLLASWKNAGSWGNPIRFISVISYALYLVHMPVRSLVLPLMGGRSPALTTVLYAGYWVLCIALATLVYRWWERPFMDLRPGLTKRILKLPAFGPND